ncbi:hypothetical protein C8J57DRAFT_1538221 [Mycena rebaudengoi]|nr:hypothetical protein C8J57DRAFT_1538221 [Mycena rebaudengoi]
MELGRTLSPKVSPDTHLPSSALERAAWATGSGGRIANDYYGPTHRGVVFRALFRRAPTHTMHAARATGVAERTAGGQHMPLCLRTHRGSSVLGLAVALANTMHPTDRNACANTGGARTSGQQMELSARARGAARRHPRSYRSSHLVRGSLAPFAFRRWEVNMPEGISNTFGLERLFKPLFQLVDISYFAWYFVQRRPVFCNFFVIFGIHFPAIVADVEDI